MLTKEARDVFEAYDRMFVTDGWKELVGDFTERKQELLSQLLRRNSNAQDLVAAKLKIEVYSYITDLETNMKEARRAEESDNE